ncbi:ABC transporter permease [Tunturiibacter psychrotolerans]|uniref:ABC transporter permease n=1 Tax=Tunturiibacter psychrotolerans TaxID=3069686 RepID=UPI003D1EEB26
MSSLRQSFQYGLRSFVRSPVFASIFAISLAVGIGAATSVFSLLNALVLRPLPLPHPEQLVSMNGIYRNHARVPITSPMFAELERDQRVFSGICGWSGGGSENLEIDGKMSLVPARSVTGGYYGVLEAQPLLGRLIGPADVQGSQASQVAVISYEMWKRQFTGDPTVVGRTIRADGKLFTIIGVTQRWFTGMKIGEEAPGITIPAGTSQQFDGGNRTLLWLNVTGRLKDGETVEGARSQLQSLWPHLLESTVSAEIKGQRRQSFLAMGLQVDQATRGVDSNLRTKVTKPLFLLLGIVALILLVVCVNLASLTLARASYRRHEISTRIALGASSWQAVHQFVAETMFLSGVGAVLALVLSVLGSRLLVVLLTRNESVPVLLNVKPDWRVFCFAVVVALFAGLFIGLIPAWQLSRQDPASAMRQGQRTLGRGTGVLGKALIVSQIAISLVLVQMAGLFLRSLEGMRTFDPGFARAGVTEVQLASVPRVGDTTDTINYRRQVLEAVGNMEAARSAAFSSVSIPAGDGGWKETASPATSTNAADAAAATLVEVSPGFFKTLAIPFVSGRDFAWTDDAHHPRVVIIDSLLAKQLFRSESAIGKRIRFGVQPDFQDLEIVGVSQTARIADVRDADAPMIFAPTQQDNGYAGTLLVRGSDGAELTRDVDAVLQSFGEEYSSSSRTLEASSERTLVYEQMTATLSTFFASVALVVAGFGLFGLMSYAVNLRTREIGVRMAMGSQRGGILRLILRESVMITLIGVGVGLPCALAASRVVAQMLFATSFADPVAVISAAMALLLTGMAAGLLPAVRAMRLNPMAALRHD